MAEPRNDPSGRLAAEVRSPASEGLGETRRVTRSQAASHRHGSARANDAATSLPRGTPNPTTPFVSSNEDAQPEREDNPLSFPYDRSGREDSELRSPQANYAQQRPQVMNPAAGFATAAVNPDENGYLTKDALDEILQGTLDDRFDGGRATPAVDAFVKTMRNYLRFGKRFKVSEATKCAFIARHLVGGPKNWWTWKYAILEKQEATGTPSNYSSEDLLQDLLRQYRDPAVPLRARADFYKLDQGKKAVRDYLSELLSLSYLCEPVIEEGEIIQRIRMGMDVSLKQALAAHPVNTGEDLFQFVQRLSLIEENLRQVAEERKELRAAKDKSTTPAPPSQKKTSRPNNYGKTKSSAQDKSKGVTVKADADDPRRPVERHHCHKLGHYAKDCFSNPANPNNKLGKQQGKGKGRT